MWRRPPRGARGVARWWRADAPRGGHQVEPDVGDEPQFGPLGAGGFGSVGSRQECGGHGPAAQGLGQVARPGGGMTAAAAAPAAAVPAAGGRHPPQRPPTPPPKAPKKRPRHFESSDEEEAPPPPSPSPSRRPRARAKPLPPQTLAPPYARKGPGPLWECAGCGGHPVCPLGGGGQWGDRQPSDGVGGLG